MIYRYLQNVMIHYVVGRMPDDFSDFKTFLSKSGRVPGNRGVSR